MHDDEVFYERAAAEIETEGVRKGLWIKAMTTALNDQDLARVYYIELRVAQLKGEVFRVERERREAASKERLTALGLFVVLAIGATVALINEFQSW